MNRVVVIGANGQDGAYLVEHLSRRGHDIVALGRQDDFRHPRPGARFSYRGIDVSDHRALGQVLDEVQPDIIFHVAARHAAAGGFYEPIFAEMLAVNTGSLHTALEHARLRGGQACRVVYASSMKVFGPIIGQVDETTPRVSTCLYSITKNASQDLIIQYRQRHGVAASALLLFNHESPLRPPDFFMSRLVGALARALAGETAPTQLHTLDFHCDWGAADEFMDIAIDIAEKAPCEDFVLASGHTWYGRDFATQFFAAHGLDHATHIQERVGQQNALASSFQVRLDKLERLIGRRPRLDGLAIANTMLAALGAAGSNTPH